MRIFEHRTQMVNRYRLTNRPLTEYVESTGDVFRPGIKLIIERCGDLEALVRSFDFSNHGTEREFSSIKQRILLTEDDDWVLTTVSVGRGDLILDYKHRRRTRQFMAKCGQNNCNGGTNNTPIYNSCSLVLCAPRVEALLRFVTPHDNGEALIKIPSRPNDNFVIIEHDGAKRRELTFSRHYSSSNEEYVWVKEFM